MRLQWTSALVAGAILVASPAMASRVTVTYSGTTSGGYDQTGVFGTPGADLSNLPFTVVMKFDTSDGYRVRNAYDDYSYGGTAYGNPGPARGAAIEVDGHKFTIAGDFMSRILGFRFEDYRNQDYF